MANAPWITIIGLGEDGLDGLSPASRAALDAAEVVMGPPRHLALVPDIKAERVEWPVPFVDGIETLKALEGRHVAVLASGDPFHFGAGRTIAHAFPDAWQAFPGPSTFSLMAARLGWPLEDTICMGLHAAPIERLRPHLAAGIRLIVLLRDGRAVADLGDYLVERGFGNTTMVVAEAVGGPREKMTTVIASEPLDGYVHPVCVGLEIDGPGVALPQSTGLPDNVFETDGVMTKRVVRAVTLSTLAPKQGEHLWDVGSGSGSIALEWLLAHPTTQATAIEPRADRVALIQSNARALGQDRLRIVHGHAPDVLSDLSPPDVVFVGGGLDALMLEALMALNPGTRLVANAVTLESEAILSQAHAEHGGELLRIVLDTATPIGPKRGWASSYPVVQWSVTI